MWQNICWLKFKNIEIKITQVKNIEGFFISKFLNFNLQVLCISDQFLIVLNKRVQKFNFFDQVVFELYLKNYVNQDMQLTVQNASNIGNSSGVRKCT